MYTTYTHATKEMITNGNFSTVDKAPASTVLKAMFLQMKARLMHVAQAPARMPEDVRDEMYW